MSSILIRVVAFLSMDRQTRKICLRYWWQQHQRAAYTRRFWKDMARQHMQLCHSDDSMCEDGCGGY